MQSDNMGNQAEKVAAPSTKKATPKKTVTTKKTAAKAISIKTDTGNAKVTAKSVNKKTAKPSASASKTIKSTTPAVKKTATKTTKSNKSTKAPTKLRLRFEIFFSTKFGETMLISGAHPALGGESTEQAPLMEFVDDQKWAITLEVSKASVKNGSLDYTYLVRYEDGSYSLSAPYRLEIPAGVTSITVRDAWNAPGFIENALGTDAMLAFVGDTVQNPAPVAKKKYTHRFIITAPALEAGKAICLIGEETALGAWDADKAIVLAHQDSGKWSVDLALKLSAPASGYKYGIYDLATNRLDSFEGGENRSLEADRMGAALLVLQNGFIRTN